MLNIRVRSFPQATLVTEVSEEAIREVLPFPGGRVVYQ